VLERVATDVTGRDVNLPQQGGAEVPEIPQSVLDQLPPEARERLEQSGEDGLLARLELPEDAGRFVIEDASVAWAYRIARYGNDVVYAIMGIAAATFALAIVVSKDRRGTIRTSGVVLALAGVVSLALLLPVGYATRTYAENKAAAESVVDILTNGYKQQSLALVGVGSVLALVAALFGNTPLAVALRSTAKRRPDGPSLETVLRERVGVLRVGGLVVAALVLIVWPEPTTRVYITTLALTAAYFGMLYFATSDSSAAVRTRGRVREFVDPVAGAAAPETDGARGWIASNAGLLRVAGAAAAVGLVLFWPALNLRFVVMVLALALIYLAAIELFSGSAVRADERP
jgi:hypothetical protein